MKFSLCLAGATLALATFGGTQSILCWTDNNRNAYSSNANQWTGKVVPAADTGKQYDYLVAYGFYLWIPESSANMTFGGASVQLGSHDPTYADATGNTAGNIFYKGDCRWLTFPDLRMYHGGLGSGANNWFGLAGNATVYSTEEKPFTFTLGTARNTDTYLDLTFAGGEDVVFGIDQVGTGWVISYADQSQTYSGSWKIGKNVRFRPTYDASRGKILNSAMAFGKPLSTFNPKSVTVGAGAILRIETYNRIFSASDNRGLWLDAAGDQVEYLMINNNAHFFGWPIAGEGTFHVSGNGAFYLQSSCDVPVRVGSGSSFVLDICSDLKKGVAVNEGGALCIRQVLTNGVPSDRPSRLSTALDASVRPIGVFLSAIPTVSTETDIPVAVIDKAVAASYTEADFDPWGVAGGQIPNAKGIVFSTDANGDTVVSVRLFPYVRSNAANAGTIVTLDNAGQWTPVGAPSAGQNYIVWNHLLRTGGAEWQNPYVVPGEEWVLYNAGYNGYCTYQSKHFNTTFAKLRFLNSTGIVVAQTDAFRTQEFSGNYDIRTTKGSNVAFAGASVKTKISATLTGRGSILVQGVSRNPANLNSDYSVEMAGDASGYVGAIATQNYSPTTYPMVFKASGETNFGGNPEHFAADALKIGAMVALTPTATMTIDDANRGVTFEATASVDTTAGDCTVKTPVVFEGAFTKSGTGMFAYGAGGTTLAEGAALTVAQGTLKVEGANALTGATVNLAAGTVLAMEATAAPFDLTGTTLTAADAKLTLRIDGLNTTATIASFATPEAAAAFVANTRTVKGSGNNRGILVANGTQVKANVVGLMVILR